MFVDRKKLQSTFKIEIWTHNVGYVRLLEPHQTFKQITEPYIAALDPNRVVAMTDELNKTVAC